MNDPQREQTRRDAETEVRELLNRLHGEGGHGWIERAAERLTIHWDRVRAELEQAKRERDEWMTPFDGSGIEWHEGLPSPYTYQASDFSKLLAAVHEYECAAEPVPALVEALRWIRDPSYVGNYGDDVALEIHRRWAARALARYEQSQGGNA